MPSLRFNHSSNWNTFKDSTIPVIGGFSSTIFAMFHIGNPSYSPTPRQMIDMIITRSHVYREMPHPAANIANMVLENPPITGMVESWNLYPITGMVQSWN